MGLSADFSGHCQACGRLQKLNRHSTRGQCTALSLHGYTVSSGYFAGTCRGSSELPFEVSCDLVKRFIAEATAQLGGLEDFRATLLREATEPKAWFYTSQASPKGYYAARTRSWKLLDIETETVTYENGTPEGGRYFKHFRGGDTSWVRFRNAQGFMAEEIRAQRSEVSAKHDATAIEVATAANKSYATWLEHEADSLRRYIAWQEERVRTWKAASLLPVKAKDKEGFKPTEAAY